MAFALGKGSTSQYDAAAGERNVKVVNPRKRSKLRLQLFHFTSSAGHIQIWVPYQDEVPDCSSKYRNLAESRFLFLPTSNWCPVGIDAYFREIINFNSEPRIYAHINALRPVNREAEYRCYDLMCFGSLEEIDKTLRRGSITPYDVDQYGTSLCISVRHYT